MSGHGEGASVLRVPRDLPGTPVGRGGAALSDPLRDRIDVLSAKEVAAIMAAGAWGTLDELSASAARSGALASHAESLALLRGLAERGVLVPEAELIARITGATDPASAHENAAGRDWHGGRDDRRLRDEHDERDERNERSGREVEIATLGIPTRGRPEALRRALETFARDIAESGRAMDVLVVDETSADGAGDDAGGHGDAGGSHAGTRALAREIERRWGVMVRCVDRRDVERFADVLAEEAGVPVSVVRHALVPEGGGVFAAGAGRNVVLLDAAGRCSLQVDDDVVCDLRRAPESAATMDGARGAGSDGGGGVRDGAGNGADGSAEHRDGRRRRLALRSFEDPTEMWFGEGAEGLGGDADGARDLAGLHGRLLGRTASALARAAADGGGLDLRRASMGFLAKIAAGGRVVCTQLGVRGDAAIGATSWMLTLPAPSRDRMLSSEAVYRAAITSRRLARAATADTITDQERCMTLAIGLDGRAPLPPFPPLRRNEDGLFGCALVACRPDALLGHLPFTVAHEPIEARATAFDEVFEQVGRLGMNDVIAGLITASRREIDVRSPAAALETLGRSLVAWSEVPARDLFERLHGMLAQSLARRLARIDALLRETRRSPSFWADDLERLGDAIRERIEDPTRAVPLEWRGRYGTEKERELARWRIFEYGQLLIHWPAIWEAARRLRERGIRPGGARRGAGGAE